MADSGFDVNNPKPVSPLSGLISPVGGISLTEVPLVGKINIRGDSDDPVFAKGVAEAVGVRLPTAPNTVSERPGTGLPDAEATEHRAGPGHNVIYWLGPDEWLVHTPPNGEGALVGTLRDKLSGVHAAVTDVSDYYVVIDLAGRHARDVLMRGTPFDVHADVFKPGQCAQTVFVKASILLHCMTDAPSYRLQVRWTYAQYLWNYLATVARQWTPTDAA
ncbi:MAG: sarcosine oxidase subunit gamma family protein [Rhodospirillales bacterium]